MSDERLRELERDPHLSDADMDELVRLYQRNQEPHFVGLVTRLEKHTGRDLWPCRDCLNGRGYAPVDQGGTMGEMAAGLLADVACQTCKGSGKDGPLRFTQGILQADYALLFDPKDECHKTPNQPCFVESISVARNEWHGIHKVRGHVMIVSKRTLMIASVAHDDWVGMQLLAKWCNRPNVCNRKISKPDVEAFKRLKPTTEPGPLVALWSGAFERLRTGNPTGAFNRSRDLDPTDLGARRV